MEPIFEGASISWEIIGDTLYLEGSGRMEFRRKPDSDIWDIPWYYLDFIHVVFKGDITSIAPETFHTSDLVDVDIPDSVTGIGALAFCKCQDLERVTFGKGLVTISEYAFADCIRLREAVLGSSVEVLGYHAFENCPSMERFTFSPCLREIGENAFFGDSSLKQVDLPASVEIVNGNPFACCSSLERITLGEGNFYFSVRNNSLLNRKGESLICVPCATRSYEFPDCVMSVGRDAFRGGSVRNISLPESVVHLDNGAFRDCRELVSVDVSHIVTIPGDCFSDDDSLSQIRMDRCVRIGPGAFRKCISLESVELPEKMGTVEEGAFIGCSGIRELKLNEGLESVGMYAFNGCSSLRELRIPESLMDIGEEAFYGCTSLEKVTMCFFLGDEDDYIPEGTDIEYLEE